MLHIPGQQLASGGLERLAHYFGAPAPPPAYALEGADRYDFPHKRFNINARNCGTSLLISVEHFC